MALGGRIENNKAILAINGIVSLALIIAILYYIGFDAFLKELAQVSLPYLALSVMFLLLMYVFMSTRIKVLLEEQGIKATWEEVLRSHFVGMLAADFTPARSGYFATAGVLHYKYGVPLEKAMVSVMGPTIFDFATKVIAGSVAVIFILGKFIDSKNQLLLFAAAGAMTLMVAVMMGLLFSARLLGAFKFVKTLPAVGGIASKAYGMFERMQANSHSIIKKTPELLGLLMLTWSAKAISWYFAAKSLGITLDLAFPEIAFYYFFQPLVTMLEFIPSPTIAGIGLSEGGAALVLSLFGIPLSKATAFSLLTRVKTIAVNLVAVPEALSLLNKKEPITKEGAGIEA